MADECGILQAAVKRLEHEARPLVRKGPLPHLDTKHRSQRQRGVKWRAQKALGCLSPSNVQEEPAKAGSCSA